MSEDEIQIFLDEDEINMINVEKKFKELIVKLNNFTKSILEDIKNL